MWTLPWVIVASAVLRGSYHLYQGFGAFVGNAIMGVVFGLFYLRFKRVAPLIVAHTLLDVVAFVGYVYLDEYLE
jgi:membrane protease YdiL (CAAX protease family)